MLLSLVGTMCGRRWIAQKTGYSLKNNIKFKGEADIWDIEELETKIFGSMYVTAKRWIFLKMCWSNSMDAGQWGLWHSGIINHIQ